MRLLVLLALHCICSVSSFQVPPTKIPRLELSKLAAYGAWLDNDDEAELFDAADAAKSPRAFLLAYEPGLCSYMTLHEEQPLIQANTLCLLYRPLHMFADMQER
jgi:hypothetical protein